MVSEFYAVYQVWVMRVALAALAALGLFCLFRALAPSLSRAYHDWLHLDGFGKFIAAGAVVMATLYGGSKGIWSRTSNDGADSGIGFVGIYTATSNDVQVVGGVTVTNKLPMVRVEWTNGTVTASTPVSVRVSNTNDWTELVKSNTVFKIEGTTNAMEFMTGDYSYAKMWWLGSDKPATVVTTSSIDITAYAEDYHSVSIAWTCSQPLATEFVIYCKKPTDAAWTQVATTANKQITVSGFWVDKDLDWKVTATYLEDGE